jgi:hypothetical protein
MFVIAEEFILALIMIEEANNISGQYRHLSPGAGPSLRSG